MPEKKRLMHVGLFKRLESGNDFSCNELFVEMAIAVVLCFGEFP